MTRLKFCAGACVIASQLLLFGCSSAPHGDSGADSGPEWTRQPARTVEGGYIIYVENAEDRLQGQSSFMAESAALQDVANECSFPPKGVRVEDRYSDTVGVLHRTYAKVAVSFQDCEEAQRTVDPEGIHRLANAALAAQLKRYQDELDQEAKEVPTQPIPGTAVAVNPTPQQASHPIHDDVGFFVVRQQIAYAKEVIILSPPAAYPPQAPQTTAFINNVQPATQQVATYQAANPAVKTSPSTWSSQSYHPAVPALAGIQGARSTIPMASARVMQQQRSASGSRYSQQKRGNSNPTNQPAPKKKRRRRY